MNSCWPYKGIAIALGAGVCMAAQPLPPNPDGTFRTEAYVFTLDTSTNNLFRKKESPRDTPLPRETLPAEDDRESAWGPVSRGYQLCLRFEKEVFQIGEPITASVIVRNASDIFLGDAVGIPGSTQFFVTGESGQEVRAKVSLPPARKPITFPLYRGTQYKYKVPLSEFFVLDRPGLYTLTVHKQVGESRAAPNVIMSGIATIRVVATKASSDSSTDRNTSTASQSSQSSHGIAEATGQTAGLPAELTSTGATAQPTHPATYAPGNDPHSGSSPS